jgi:hypothetical protein
VSRRLKRLTLFKFKGPGLLASFLALMTGLFHEFFMFMLAHLLSSFLDNATHLPVLFSSSEGPPEQAAGNLTKKDM